MSKASLEQAWHRPKKSARLHHLIEKTAHFKKFFWTIEAVEFH